MGAITDPTKKVTLPPADDPFFYGWRDICRILPDGTVVWEQVPLTMEDCLHPLEGDSIPESDLHQAIRNYLATVLRCRYADDPTVLVLSNSGVYWEDPGLDHHCPDVCVIFGVRHSKPEWQYFHVVEEGTKPSLIIEVVSPNRRSNDVDTKVQHYHQLQIPYYVILDRKSLGGEWRLISYRFTPESYVEVPPNEQGWVWLEPVGLWLGLKNNQPRLFDGKTREEIGDYQTICQSLREQQARANAEKARADAEALARQQLEARLRILEEELRQRRGNDPS